MWTYRATLKRVVDADTLDVVVDLGFRVYVDIRVRLLGAWAPERYTAAGIAATAYAQRLLADPEIVIRTEHDRSFARWLASVALADGTDYASRLVAAGHAMEERG